MAGKSLSNPDRTRLMKCSQVYQVQLPETMTTLKKERPKKPPLCPHKKTDFRYEIWLKERKSLREKAKRNSFRVNTAEPPPGFPRKGLVTIDTCKAGTNSDVVRLCLQELGWREYPFGKRDGGVCDLYWQAATFCRTVDLPGGKVNKFPGMIEVTGKINLDRTLDIMRKLFPEEFSFHPRSWFLPQQFAEFTDAVRRLNEKQKTKSHFIVKPDEGSQGDGIYLITDAKDYIFNGKYHVVQEYLADPLLLEDLKFDLRIYVVLKSLEPLEIYIYNEGLARFCTVPYEAPNNSNIHKAYMHLTNYSLNKHSEGYEHTENEDDGSKRSMRSVFKRLRHKGYDVDRIWEDIRKLVVKTLIALAPDLKVELHSAFPNIKPGGPKCFQELTTLAPSSRSWWASSRTTSVLTNKRTLVVGDDAHLRLLEGAKVILGFDVLINNDLSVKLLEVNSNPSLRIDFEREVAPGITEYIHSPLDEEIKRPLVTETLLLMAPRNKFRRRIVESEESGSETTDGEDGEEPECVSYGSTQLARIYPEPYSAIYDHLRIMDRTVEIFLHCLGVRGSLRMGPTAFRNFVRRCKLQSGPGSKTAAAFDIMYIDLQRRWEYVNTDKTGLCYQGFLEAFLSLAQQKFAADDVLASVEDMLDFCECNLEFGSDHKPKPWMLPKLSKHDRRLDELKSIYGSGGSRLKGNNYFIDYKDFPVDTARRRRKPLGPIRDTPE